jgi:hypothetical protein
MTPNNVWGPFAWRHLHFVALNYPENPSFKDIEMYKEFVELFGKTLPCYMCSQNFSRHLSVQPLTNDVLKNNISFFNWTVRLHNFVNKELGKIEITEERAYELYSKPGKRLSRNTIIMGYVWILLVMILLIVISIWIYKSSFLNFSAS